MMYKAELLATKKVHQTKSDVAQDVEVDAWSHKAGQSKKRKN